MSMCLRRHHLRGPGNAETASLARPHPPHHHHRQWRNRHYTMPQKGSNYRMDGRLLCKYEAADRPGRACWCQVSNKYQQDRVTAELPGVDSVWNTDTFQHQKQAKARGETEAIDFFFFWSLRCCPIVSKRSNGNCDATEIRSRSWQIIQHSISSKKKKKKCPKMLLAIFKSWDLTAALKHISPSVCAELCIVTH